MQNNIPFNSYFTGNFVTNVIEPHLDFLAPRLISLELAISAQNIKQENVLADLEKTTIKTAYKFGTNYYVYYHIGEKVYVDVCHIISSMELWNSSSEKVYYNNYKNIFRKYSDCICERIWDVRADDSIILRELIDLNAMGRIILSTKSEFSTIFIKECALYMAFLYFMYLVLFFLFVCYTNYILNKKLIN